MIEYLKLKEKLQYLEIALISKWVIIIFSLVFSIYLILTMFKKEEIEEEKKIKKSEPLKKESKEEKFTQREKEFLYKKKLQSKADFLVKK